MFQTERAQTTDGKETQEEIKQRVVNISKILQCRQSQRVQNDLHVDVYNYHILYILLLSSHEESGFLKQVTFMVKNMLIHFI